MLIDGDLNRSAMQWAQGGHLPFAVVPEQESPSHLSRYPHIVIDTPSRPSAEELRSLAESSDLLVIPTTPGVLAIGALVQTVDTFAQIGVAQFRVLLTMVPTYRSSVTAEARTALEDVRLPLFHTDIRHYVAYEYAALQGRTVRDLDYNNADKAWSDYAAVGKELVG